MYMDLVKRLVLEIDYCNLCAYVKRIDTTDFTEDEIRTIEPKNPFHFHELDKWDGELKVKQPEPADYGINKNKDLYQWKGREWKIVVHKKSTPKECI